MQISQNKNIGFASSRIRLPLARLEKMLDKNHQQLSQKLTTDTISENDNIPLLIKRHGVFLGKFYDENRTIMSNEQRDFYQVDFLHDVSNKTESLALQYYDLFDAQDILMQQRLARNLLKSCRSAYNAVLKTSKNYQFFLDNGMETAGNPLGEVFDMSHSQLAEIIQQKKLQVSIINKHLLKEKVTSHIHDFSLFTVFSNLLGNAVKYTHEKGQIAVQFFKKQTTHKYDFIMMTITDSGIGIPPEQIQKALNGKRASNAVKSGISGTGYGLEKVKKISNRYFAFPIQVKSPVNPSSKDFSGTEITCPVGIIKKERV